MEKIIKLNNKINKIIILFSIVVSLYYLYNGYYFDSLKRLIIIPIVLAPDFIRKVFKKDFNHILQLMFIPFIFFAWYLGDAINIYNKLNGYDKVIHTIFGILSSFLAFFIMKHYKIYNKYNFTFNIIFIVSFTLAFGSIWEMFEFTWDKILGTNEQGVVETGVDDTMYDLIVAFLGTSIFCISYYYELFFRKKLIITKYINLLD